MPDYLSKVTLDASTENFYWASRMIGALADASYNSSAQLIERYQDAVVTKGRQIVRTYDSRIAAGEDASILQKANEELCAMAKEQSTKTLNKVLHEASLRMKNGYNRADN